MTAPARLRLTPPETIYAWTGTRWSGSLAEAAFALDELLGGIVRTTTQPIVGQMRLTWWHEALSALDRGEQRAHPVLAALAEVKAPSATLANTIDGWERLLEPEAPDEQALAAYAAERGGTLFAVIAGEQGDAASVRAAGAGWALADLAANVSDPVLAARAAALASRSLEEAFAARWRPAWRAAGALAVDARAAIAGKGDAGAPARAARVLRFRLTGR